MGVPDGGPSGGMLCMFAAMVRAAEQNDLRSSGVCGAMFWLPGIFGPKGRRFLAKFPQGKSVGKRCRNTGSKRELTSKSRAGVRGEMFARADGLQREVLLSWIVVSFRVAVELARWS